MVFYWKKKKKTLAFTTWNGQFLKFFLIFILSLNSLVDRCAEVLSGL